MIGIDLSFIRPDHKNGGTESYIKNLMSGFVENELEKEFIYFIHEDLISEYRDMFPTCQFNVYKSSGNHRMRTLKFQTTTLPKLVKEKQIELLFFPTYMSGLRKNFGVPVVMNPHDIQFKYYPEYFSRLKRMGFHFFYKSSFVKSKRIIAISEYVKRSLLEHYYRECKDKITVIHNPINFDYEKAKEMKQIEKPYILTVNSLQKHKNLITLLKAFKRIEPQIQHNLVLVGIKGGDAQALEDYKKQNGLEDRVILTGYITDEQISWLYKNAELFVTTSMYEGFGMTPIEAMGAGCPVISTKDTSLKEVTMGLATYYEPSTDAYALAECMKEKLQQKQPQEQKEEITNKVVAHYNRTIIAKKYYEVFKSIIK